jgi:hypothetical protein
VFNRRVPKHAQIGFEKSFAHVNLGSELATASLIAERLTAKLDEIWTSPTVVPVDLAPLVKPGFYGAIVRGRTSAKS